MKLFKAGQYVGEAQVIETEKAELLRLRKENDDLKPDREYKKNGLPLLPSGSLGYERQAFALMLGRRPTSASFAWSAASPCPGRVATPGWAGARLSGRCGGRTPSRRVSGSTAT